MEPSKRTTLALLTAVLVAAIFTAGQALADLPPVPMAPAGSPPTVGPAFPLWPGGPYLQNVSSVCTGIRRDHGYRRVSGRLGRSSSDRIPSGRRAKGDEGG